MSSGAVTPSIDLHAHLAIPELDPLISDEPGYHAQRAREFASTGADSLEITLRYIAGVADRLTDPDSRIAAMDAGGVDVQVVSAVPIPHPWAPGPLAVRIARTTNEAIAEHCAHYSDRLIGVANVPLQHPDVAAAELTRAVIENGLRAVMIPTTPWPGGDLDAPELEPFWARVEELDVPVLMHPHGCHIGDKLSEYYLFNLIGNPLDTTIALSRIILSGLLDRHPGLRFWSAHGGGYLPTYIGRTDHAWGVRPDVRGCAEPPSSYLRKMWFDSLVFTPTNLRHLVESVGADRVTLGSDYPFDMGVSDPVARLEAVGFDSGTVDAIRGRNALALLGTRAGL